MFHTYYALWVAVTQEQRPCSAKALNVRQPERPGITVQSMLDQTSYSRG